MQQYSISNRGSLMQVRRKSQWQGPWMFFHLWILLSDSQPCMDKDERDTRTKLYKQFPSYMKYQIQGVKVADEPFIQLLYFMLYAFEKAEKAVPGSASELVWSSSWKRGMKPNELWLVRRDRSAPSEFILAEGSGGGECLLPEGYRNHSCHKNFNSNQQRILPTWFIPR